MIFALYRLALQLLYFTRTNQRASLSRQPTAYNIHLDGKLHEIWLVRPLTVSKIIKIVATSFQILRLKCTKFDFGWGSAPDPAGGAYMQRSPRPPSWI